MEKEEHIKFTDHLEIHVLELPKVQRSEELTDEDLLTKWMLFLSGDDKTKGEVAMTDLGIEKAYDELHRISDDEVMRERKEEGKKETVLSMHTEGFSVETIAGVMKMPEEKVLSIISQTQ